jgi:hypothetical protein
MWKACRSCDSISPLTSRYGLPDGANISLRGHASATLRVCEMIAYDDVEGKELIGTPPSGEACCEPDFPVLLRIYLSGTKRGNEYQDLL